MKVSVLVPVYNMEKYLGKCLQSLCEQTLSDIEILCINDGSTDASKTIIESFCLKDSRVKMIDKKNTGYGNSMNIGMDQAKGKYLAIVESDDFVEPDMMKKLYEKAEIHQLDVVKSSFYSYTDEDGIEENQYADLFNDLTMDEVFCPLHKSRLFIKMQTIWSALYNRNFLFENHIRFHETPGASYQDVSFAFQVYACAKRMMLIPDAFYHYRIDNVHSSVKAPDKVFCVCDELEKIESFIVERHRDVEQLRMIASRLGYRIMMETYHNLAEVFQYALFLKMTEYLRNYKKAGFIYEEMWEKEATETVEEILDDPKKYFMKTAKSFQDDRLMSDICLNQRIYTEAVLERILSSSRILIYGAGKLGTKFLGYLRESGYTDEKISFAVTSMQGNEPYVSGISVHPLEFYQKQKKEATVVLAVKGQSQFEIADRLERQGFSEVISLDHRIWKYLLKFGMVRHSRD
ncbi:MAG: glycosyltransferase [Lachnospiraceae bacterium]|nr:glycosyltransferase [Lachnospiraceae bacterium]